jgi:hypothetical protein
MTPEKALQLSEIGFVVDVQELRKKERLGGYTYTGTYSSDEEEEEEEHVAP